jgi:hypothetical protein
MLRLRLPNPFIVGLFVALLAVGIFVAMSYHYTTATPAAISSATSTAPTALNTKSQNTFADELAEIEAEQQAAVIKKAKARQAKIDRVEAFFRSYGAKMTGYGHILVDQAEKCGGDYRVLVGIAGSESGLGRAMYKKYNPYGYLNGVQYSSLTEALTYLSCKVSSQHIAPCGTDLYCLAKRYAGPQDDLEHFVGKVRWFMNQV